MTETGKPSDFRPRSVADRLRARTLEYTKRIQDERALQTVPFNTLVLEALELQREYSAKLEERIKELEAELVRR